MSAIDLRCGDAIELLRTLPDCSVDAVVTDPDYELIVHPSIRLWGGVPKVDWAAECLRVLRPGGHLLAFGGSRTYHRLAVAVEDAGFEIRDSLIYLYGGGFPKSHNISKAIDKAAGAEREVTGRTVHPDGRPRSQAQRADGVHGGGQRTGGIDRPITAPATDEAKQWDGWGSALKPGYESIVCARKPLTGTLAANVLEHGTGGLNVDACRIGDGTRINPPAGNKPGGTALNMSLAGMPLDAKPQEARGRWPANVILDEDAAAELDARTGTLKSGKILPHHIDHGKTVTTYGAFQGSTGRESYGDSGGASRFFYTAKASKRERPVTADGFRHPTVKPLSLLSWVVRLVTPLGGTVLDPFAGSGTTVEACLLEGFNCIAFDIDPRAIELCQVRVERNRPDAIG